MLHLRRHGQSNHLHCTKHMNLKYFMYLEVQDIQMQHGDIKKHEILIKNISYSQKTHFMFFYVLNKHLRTKT
jgi:hypothetical protein